MRGLENNLQGVADERSILVGLADRVLLEQTYKESAYRGNALHVGF